MKAQKYNLTKIMNVATSYVSTIVTLAYSWDMADVESFALQTEWGKNLTGTFQLWERLTSDADWQENTVASFTNPAKSASGQVMDNIGAVAPHWRLTFTRTSGLTGPLEAWLYIKGEGV